MPLHDHEPAYVGVVLTGSYTETIGRRKRNCGPLTTAFHPQGESHSVVFHDSAVRIFRIEMTQSWLDRIGVVASLPSDGVTFDGGVPPILALRLRSEFRARDRWSRLSIEGVALELIAELCRATSNSPTCGVPKWLQDAGEILGSEVSISPSLTALAEAVGVHPVHLAREFRKRYRCTIGDFIRRRRVEFACREIARSDTPLSEIALASGFCDQSHFTNTFRRFTGMTPAAYRTSCK
jgi:AraC family transcriptional regulator